MSMTLATQPLSARRAKLENESAQRPGWHNLSHNPAAATFPAELSINSGTA
jgi:hypothetical protein